MRSSNNADSAIPSPIPVLVKGSHANYWILNPNYNKHAQLTYLYYPSTNQWFIATDGRKIEINLEMVPFEVGKNFQWQSAPKPKLIDRPRFVPHIHDDVRLDCWYLNPAQVFPQYIFRIKQHKFYVLDEQSAKWIYVYPKIVPFSFEGGIFTKLKKSPNVINPIPKLPIKFPSSPMWMPATANFGAHWILTPKNIQIKHSIVWIYNMDNNRFYKQIIDSDGQPKNEEIEPKDIPITISYSNYLKLKNYPNITNQISQLDSRILNGSLQPFEVHLQQNQLFGCISQLFGCTTASKSECTVNTISMHSVSGSDMYQSQKEKTGTTPFYINRKNTTESHWIINPSDLKKKKPLYLYYPFIKEPWFIVTSLGQEYQIYKELVPFNVDIIDNLQVPTSRLIDRPQFIPKTHISDDSYWKLNPSNQNMPEYAFSILNKRFFVKDSVHSKWIEVYLSIVPFDITESILEQLSHYPNPLNKIERLSIKMPKAPMYFPATDKYSEYWLLNPMDHIEWIYSINAERFYVKIGAEYQEVEASSIPYLITSPIYFKLNAKPDLNDEISELATRKTTIKISMLQPFERKIKSLRSLTNQSQDSIATTFEPVFVSSLNVSPTETDASHFSTLEYIEVESASRSVSSRSTSVIDNDSILTEVPATYKGNSPNETHVVFNPSDMHIPGKPLYLYFPHRSDGDWFIYNTVNKEMISIYPEIVPFEINYEYSFQYLPRRKVLRIPQFTCNSDGNFYWILNPNETVKYLYGLNDRMFYISMDMSYQMQIININQVPYLITSKTFNQLNKYPNVSQHIEALHPIIPAIKQPTDLSNHTN